MAGLADIIHELKTEKGLSEELVKIVIEDFLKAAYKKRFDTDENVAVYFSNDNSEVALYSKKTIVSEVEDEVRQIVLADARELEPDCELGDQLLIEINPQDFSRNEVRVANQRALQRIREFESDSLQSEFKSKVGEIVIGYYLREANKNIIVDLGKTEGLLPKRFQSPKEIYRVGDKIKALVHSVERTNGNRLEVVLSRTHAEFVKKIFELEVPELYDGTVEIVKIVREPGYRTKIAVRSLHSEIDPIGTCVGAKGSRINNVMLELDNERIDILRYDSDPLTFIHNSLSPAEVKQVVVFDYAQRNAIAVVEDDVFPIAIGKLGLNVRLANRLTDWNISVKTETEFKEMSESNEMLKNFFEDPPQKAVAEEVDISEVRELPGLRADVIKKLEAANVKYIEDLLHVSNADLTEKGLDADEIKHVRVVLKEVIELDVPDAPSGGSAEAASADAAGENDDALISVLPLSDAVRAKLAQAGIEKLYDLALRHSNGTLQQIEGLTDEDRNEIETVIRENIEYEE